MSRPIFQPSSNNAPQASPLKGLRQRHAVLALLRQGPVECSWCGRKMVGEYPRKIGNNMWEQLGITTIKNDMLTSNNPLNGWI